MQTIFPCVLILKLHATKQMLFSFVSSGAISNMAVQNKMQSN
jgi:hypothetical protein